MMVLLKKSPGERYRQDSRRLRLEREQPTEFSYPAACRSGQTNAPPAENALRARRNCLLLRSVVCSEPLPRDQLVEAPDHPAVPQMSFAFRAAFDPVWAARCGPLFHSASSEGHQAA